MGKSKKDHNSVMTWGGRVVRRCWVNFQCQGVLLTWLTVGQGPIVLSVGAGGGCLDIFSLIYHFSFLSPSLWETARYRLKYCLKGPLSPKQPTNQSVMTNRTTTKATCVPLLFHAESINASSRILAFTVIEVSRNGQADRQRVPKQYATSTSSKSGA